MCCGVVWSNVASRQSTSQAKKVKTKKRKDEVERERAQGAHVSGEEASIEQPGGGWGVGASSKGIGEEGAKRASVMRGLAGLKTDFLVSFLGRIKAWVRHTVES